MDIDQSNDAAESSQKGKVAAGSGQMAK